MSRVFVCGVVVVVLFTHLALAGGWDNSLIGARAGGMAASFVAMANDATAIFYNPAGLIYCGPAAEVILGGKMYFPTHTYISPQGTKSISNVNVFLPELFTYYHLSDRAAVGVGLYVPYGGGGVNWQRSQVGYDMKAAIGIAAFSPTLSYAFGSNLALGVNFNVYYTLNSSKIHNPFVSLGSGQTVEVEEKALNWSASVGILYRPTEDVSFGLILRGPVTIQTSGETIIDGNKFDSETQFNLPTVVGLGIAYKFKPEFFVSAEFDYYQWSTLDKVEHTTYSTPMGTITQSTKFGFKDSFYIKVGGEYYLSNDISLRGGASYDRAAAPKSTLSLDNIDVNKISLLGGLSYRLDWATVDLAGFISSGIQRNVPPTTPEIRTAGDFDLDAMGLLVSLTRQL